MVFALLVPVHTAPSAQPTAPPAQPETQKPIASSTLISTNFATTCYGVPDEEWCLQHDDDHGGDYCKSPNEDVRVEADSNCPAMCGTCRCGPESVDTAKLCSTPNQNRFCEMGFWETASKEIQMRVAPQVVQMKATCPVLCNLCRRDLRVVAAHTTPHHAMSGVGRSLRDTISECFALSSTFSTNQISRRFSCSRPLPPHISRDSPYVVVSIFILSF